MKYFLFFISIFVLLFLGCKVKAPAVVEKPKPPAAFVCDRTPSFEKDIKPIFSQYCAGCHGDSEYGFNLLIAEDARVLARKGELTATINHAEGYPAMPQSGEKLNADLIKLIECWVKTEMKD
ncbi:MAG: cytochrome c [Bacteroidota bacterium]|nr:cytochrome c [Bacteroidota bacterium]